MSNMYTGKSSRNPYSPLLYYGIIGLLLIAFGIYQYTELAAWEVIEDSTEEYSMHSILWGVYDLGGKNAILGAFSFMGLSGLFVGWQKTTELKKLKNQAKA